MNAAGPRFRTAAEIAALVRGRLVGPGDVTVARVAPLDRAGPGDLTFLAGPRYLAYFHAARGAVALVPPGLAPDEPGPAARIEVADPHGALMALLPVLYPEPASVGGVHPTATIGAGARWVEPVTIGPHAVLGRNVRLGRNARLGAGCVLGDEVEVGDDVVLHPQVTCYSGTSIGSRVVIHAGARLGSDGFGFLPGQDGAPHRKIPHVGRCLVGDDVEIGANTCIDRGSIDDTVIGPGTKIDNLVHVAHNVRIGARCFIAAQVGIAGSSRIGDGVQVAGQVGVGDHVTVGDGARLLGQSGVSLDVAPGATVWGYPARDNREALRALGALYRLAPLARQIQALVNAKETDGSTT